MKRMELSQMKKKMREDVPECNWLIWQDAKHANLRLPNGAELQLVKTGPMTVSVTPRVANNDCQAIEVPEFTEEVTKATGLNLNMLSYEQLVVVVKTILSLRKPYAKYKVAD
jgi:hypothetical protein